MAKPSSGRLAAVLLLSAGVLGPGPAGAEQPPATAYGPNIHGMYTLQAHAFAPLSGDGANFLADSTFARGCSSPCTFVAPVTLPGGSFMHELDLEACDLDAAAEVRATLFRSIGTSAAEALATVGTGVPDQSPCRRLHVALQPHTVDNGQYTYLVRVDIDGSSLDTRFLAVRIWYGLQVSPAPATATFPNDVPTTHPAFRFVEALAAAQITAGCAPGSFCPDAPVTRAQMAVFLATALGLHFPFY